LGNISENRRGEFLTHTGHVIQDDILLFLQVSNNVLLV